MTILQTRIADGQHRQANRALARANRPQFLYTGSAPTEAVLVQRDTLCQLRYALAKCERAGSGVETPEVDILLGAIGHLEEER